jgi:hypothetical protein
MPSTNPSVTRTTATQRSRVSIAFIVATVALGFSVHGEIPAQKHVAGADTWWSLKPIVKPPLPLVPSGLRNWVRSPIDAFVSARLAEKGLEPSPEADRRTLIRRVTFDLIGLPPTPDEIEAFVNETAADAYERLVDRLLSSPHYGERWARHWMDVVHFAETHGHDQDVPRDHAWPYRDYLIAAFNQDKPYARIVQEQIAADVLFPDDPKAVPALGFLAAGPWDESSLRDIREDSIDRKAAQYLDRDDMVGTVGLSLLSTTVQCARCHKHKFDPITQKEYYGLQAIFAGVDRANRAYDADPRVAALRRDLTKKKKLLDQGFPEAAALLAEPGARGRVEEWEKARVAGNWQLVKPLHPTSSGGATVTELPDHSLLFGGHRPQRDTYTIAADSELHQITAVRLEVLADDSLPHRGPGRQENGNLHLSEFKVELIPAGRPNDRQPVALAQALADFNQKGWEVDRAIDGKSETAWGIYPAIGQSHCAVFLLKEPLEMTPGSQLLITLQQQHGGGHLIGRARLALSDAKDLVALQPLPASIEKTLALPGASRTPQAQKELALFALRQLIAADHARLPAQKLVYSAAAEFTTDGSFRPAKGCRPIQILRRGDINQPQGLARPGALSFGVGLDANFTLIDSDNEGSRRAALALWVSDTRNPLTWRSIVNRMWHYHFGRGLCATPDDFGKMGDQPSHPELLDWLAVAFLEDGGSLKALHRCIVCSSSYRQAYTTNPTAARLDADNVLLWRMNIKRLEAEAIRDAVLQISGKLDPSMGGPSVKLFKQSPGIHRTPKVDYDGFDPDAPGAHRRSVYRFLFRTVPDPFMSALDCPDASQFTAVRSVSVTALQALALLNDPFMVRMSEHFAKRIAAAGSERDQVRRAYQLALGRFPSEHECQRLLTYAQQHGMANACRVLLNSNEFVFVP